MVFNGIERKVFIASAAVDDLALSLPSAMRLTTSFTDGRLMPRGTSALGGKFRVSCNVELISMVFGSWSSDRSTVASRCAFAASSQLNLLRGAQVVFDGIKNGKKALRYAFSGAGLDFARTCVV